MHEVFVLSCPEFPNIPNDFPKTSECGQKCDDILVCCDKVKCLFGFFSGILNLTFIINVLKNNSSRFVNQA